MKKIIIAVIGLLMIPAMVQASFSPAPYADRKVERLLESGVETVVADTGMLGAATVEAEPVVDTDVANKAYVDAHAGNGNGSYDTYVIDVIISPDESDTITHNIGTITPTVVTYSDTEVPYSIVDVPTTIIDSNNIRLDVSGDTYIGKVKVSN